MKTKIKLTKSLISKLIKQHPVLVFNRDFDLVYEKQIPNTVIALIEGEIQLTKKSKTSEKITEACLLGLYNLLNHHPVKFGCRVKSDSKVVLLGKSELREHLENKKSELHQIVKDELFVVN